MFKGGTALKKAYFGEYRFSEDLDFSAEGAATGADLETAVRGAVAITGRLLAEHGPFDLDVQRHVERSPHPGGQDAFDVRIRFPWHPSHLCRIRVEITHDEPILWPATRRPILHSYDEAIDGAPRTYSLTEIVAEKLRALRQKHSQHLARGWHRPRARDYFDLWSILSRYHRDLDLAGFPELLSRKFAVRGVTYESVDDFFLPMLVEEAERTWDAAIRPFVSDAPAATVVLQELRDILAREPFRFS